MIDRNDDLHTHLSARAINALCGMFDDTGFRVAKVADLEPYASEITANELLKVPSTGRKTVNEIIGFVARLGLQVSDSQEQPSPYLKDRVREDLRRAQARLDDAQAAIVRLKQEVADLEAKLVHCNDEALTPKLERAAVAQDRINRILGMKQNGMTTAAIAEQEGVSTSRVLEIIRSGEFKITRKASAAS